MMAWIDLDRDTGRYYPREVVTGSVNWSSRDVPLAAAVRLRWRTEGKSWPADQAVGGIVQLDDVQRVDRRMFELILPVMPYSFSGSILSIVWQVELVVRFRWHQQKIEASRVVTMSPTGDPIDPYRR